MLLFLLLFLFERLWFWWKKHYKSCLAVHEFGGIPPLLDLLKSKFPVLQHLALKTLQCVTTDEDARSTFRNKGGFEKLMDILHNQVSGKETWFWGTSFHFVAVKWRKKEYSNRNICFGISCTFILSSCTFFYFFQEFSDLHIEALQVVANCLRDDEAVQQLHEGGGLKRLVDFILTPNNPEIQSTAIKCLSRVAQSCKRTYKKYQREQKVFILSVQDVIYDIFSTCFFFFYLCCCMCSWKPQSSPWAGSWKCSSKVFICDGHQRENICLSGCGCHELPPTQPRPLQRAGYVYRLWATTGPEHSFLTKCKCV